jgi:hypothetical protein
VSPVIVRRGPAAVTPMPPMTQKRPASAIFRSGPPEDGSAPPKVARCSAHATAPAVSNGRKTPRARAAAGRRDFSPGGALWPMSLAQGPLRAATAHGGV